AFGNTEGFLDLRVPVVDSSERHGLPASIRQGAEASYDLLGIGIQSQLRHKRSVSRVHGGGGCDLCSGSGQTDNPAAGSCNTARVYDHAVAGVVSVEIAVDIALNRGILR